MAITNPDLNPPDSTGGTELDIHALTAKTSLTDLDEGVIADSAASFANKKITWANIKAAIKSYYDSVTATLTNKTLTSPVINTPTGIVKGDVGLGNVDNTSDSTKDSATATLTNKTISASANTITNLTRGFMHFNAQTISPADATTYYFGSIEYNAPEAFANIRKVYFPTACTIKAAIFQVRNTTGGSSENVTVAIRLNNTTDYDISTTSQWTTTGGYDTVSNTSINVPIAAGDFIEIKIVCPTWATNPLNCRVAATLSIE